MHLLRTFKAFSLALALGALTPGLVWAQANTGQISGRVTDSDDNARGLGGLLVTAESDDGVNWIRPKRSSSATSLTGAVPLSRPRPPRPALNMPPLPNSSYSLSSSAVTGAPVS